MNKFLALLKKVKSESLNNKRVFFVVIFALLLSLMFAFLNGGKNTHQEKRQTEKILGTKFIPSPTHKPTLIPTITPAVVVRRTILPTVTQVPTPQPKAEGARGADPTSSPTNTVSNNLNTTTPTPTPNVVTTTPTLTPSPTPVPSSSVEIAIDYGGQKTPDSYTADIEVGESAWEATKKALGIENLQYTDYGGDLGIFIIGFNGVAAAGNQYYEFRVNGVSSNVGVSSYICNKGDKLEFILTTF